MKTPRTTDARRVALATPLLVLGLALGACSGDDNKDGEPKGTDTGSTEAAAAQDETPSGEDHGLDGVEGAINELSDFTCEEKGGTWSAKGKVGNSTDADATYVVEVSVHSKKAGTVFGQAEKKLVVKAGKEESFELADIYSGKETKVDCTPRVIRGS